jgi:hypothetical protein
MDFLRDHTKWPSLLLGFCLVGYSGLPPAVGADPTSREELQIEVTKKGKGKEVSARQGNKEWFMLIEVTPENTVIIRQEKENENYLVDESENHDREMTPGEIDSVIDAFVNKVKTDAKHP